MFPDLTYFTPEGDPADASAAGVIVYGLSYCEHCAEGKKLLQSMGVPFVTTNLDTLDPDTRRPALHKLRTIYGRRVLYPVLEVDGTLTFGYDLETWRKAVAPLLERVL